MYIRVLLMIFTHTDGIINLLLRMPCSKANTIYIVGKIMFGKGHRGRVLWSRGSLCQKLVGAEAFEQRSLGAEPQKHVGAEGR